MTTRFATFVGLLVVLALLVAVLWTLTGPGGEALAPGVVPAKLAAASPVDPDRSPMLADSPAPARADRAEPRPAEAAPLDERGPLVQPGQMSVRVVDETGAPVEGVPLLLFAADDELLLWEAARHLTGESGDVLFERLPRGDEYRVGIALALDPPVSAPVRPGGIVELVAPALGSLDFELVGAEGERLDVTIAVIDVFPSRSEPRTDILLRACLASFPCRLRLPFHQDYTVEVATPEWMPAKGGSWPGLSAASPRREHRLVLRERKPTLVGRLLFDDGRPFTETAWLAWTGDPHQKRHAVPCDGSGAFRSIVVNTHGRSDAVPARLLARSGSGLLDLECELELPWQLPTGDIALGDLVLQARTVLVGGRIEGERLGPARSTSLHAYERSIGATGWTSLRSTRTSNRRAERS